MKSIENTAWYRAWRREEAYMLPLTPEGMQRANIRAESFKNGFEAGVRAASVLLEKEHSRVKKEHSFYLKASRLVKEIF